MIVKDASAIKLDRTEYLEKGRKRMMKRKMKKN